MQNTKLTFTLTQADEPIPAPDEGGDEVVPSEEETVVVPDTGTFTGTNNTNAASSIALVFSAVLLITIAMIVAVRKMKKNGKLGFVAPVLFIGAILAGTAGTLANRGFADTNDDTDYANISAPETIELTSELDKEGNTFSSTKATITMNDATNYGYELYALAGADALAPKTEGNETTISSIEETGALSANTYGYTLEPNANPEDEVWYPLSTVASLIYSTDTSTEAEATTDIYFGILTDKDATPDAYELELSFYGIAATINSIEDLTYMQDFAKLSAEEKASVIESMTIRTDKNGPSYTLKDKRDDTEYSVGRLSNNKIFMLSELALSNLDENNEPRVLTAEDSDITPNDEYQTFTMPSTIMDATEGVDWDDLLPCKATMAIYEGGHYGYNWFSNTANPYECEDPKSNITEEANSKALGSICPAGWTVWMNDDDAVFGSEDTNPGNLYSIENLSYWGSAGAMIDESSQKGDSYYVEDYGNGLQVYPGYDDYINLRTNNIIRCAVKE